MAAAGFLPTEALRASRLAFDALDWPNTPSAAASCPIPQYRATTTLSQLILKAEEPTPIDFTQLVGYFADEARNWVGVRLTEDATRERCREVETLARAVMAT